jgi:excisionase family DNA binding protein
VAELNMSDNNPQAVLGQMMLDAIKDAVKEALHEAAAANGHSIELLSAEELAARLKVPLSWVYEQSRQGNIPTHRLGRYIRFDLQEVINSRKKN